MNLLKPFIILLLLAVTFQRSMAQKYKPVIQPYQLVKADPRLIVRSGFLIVPENRRAANGRSIKIPFIFVRRPEQDAKKGISLYTTGGPGYSTTANIDSISYNSGFLKFGGFIAFDQRGTKRAQPCLDCAEVDTAIKNSYKQGLNKDSLVMLAVAKCRKKFAGQGIDLSAYNTTESAEDINDLRLALQIDSLNLVGISYSGGLMLTVAKNHPEGVRTLILNSPLPTFVNYEEHALFNINEALEQVFKNCEADSVGKAYINLRERFHKYFTALNKQTFKLKYLERGNRDSLDISYTKNELIDAIVSRLNTSQVKTVPAVLNDIMSGRHSNYIREVLDGYFAGDKQLSLGMRYSVYCAGQIAYADERKAKQQQEVLPWLSGYAFNNVDYAICSCWKVKPEPAITKSPFYSAVPVLVVSGDIDPWCSTFYNRSIKRTMPNTQLMIRHNKGHAPGYTVDGVDYVEHFLANPFKKLISQSKDLIIE
jgi:pimeloyl-ACP methyl ester carboxylesterase